MKTECGSLQQQRKSFCYSLATALLLAGVIFSSCNGVAQVIPPPGLVIGSANTATADPPVPRPKTTPCVVPLFTAIAFADFSPKSFSFAPPAACPGPWAKVVLNADFSIQAGRQFDRTAEIWIGGVNVYFGTTSEPSRTVARSWHIERDLTDYSALFKTSQNGRVDLGNLVNATFTSTLFGTAELQFYPARQHRHRVPQTADVVLPLASDPTGGTAFLSTTNSTLAKTFNLPTNVERAFLDVVAQSQAGDEFWYTCVPDDVAGELQSCGATGFRETEVAIDGHPAGVAPVYPWIYTGGIDPLLWRPIPGVQTLNFVPYRVDLTPFAGLLSNGQPHQVAVSVFNANNGFSTTATLLLFQDRESKVVTGELTRNTLSPAPAPVVVENLTNTSGNISGSVTVSSSRQFSVAGFVRTSHGRVETEVKHTIKFTNRQDFNITNTAFVQNITQRTNISSQTITDDGEEPRVSFQRFRWPLDLNFSFITNPDGTSAQTTTIRQQYLGEQAAHGDEGEETFSVISNTVTPSDTLLFDASFNVIGNQGQQSAQKFFSNNSSSGCFSRSITAAKGVLTAITDGAGCEDSNENSNKKDGDDD
ncbi:MAG TPA: peptide-N4-asparagine amidase [Terriglobales bacterium]|nr:peptide-N4-asparagine amidase [Terriglobales bacterium]